MGSTYLVAGTKNTNHHMRAQKTFSRFRAPRVETPNLVEAQTTSYQVLMKDGIKDVADKLNDNTNEERDRDKDVA